MDFIKDSDCTKETPVRLGVPDTPIYGKGITLKPRVQGRTDSEHFKKIYLPELLPLEEYDLIVVLISGGSAYLKICVADTVVSNLDRLGELEELGGKRHKFPAKGGTHSGRWCSGNLKAAVQDSVTANLEQTKRDKKILIVSGERRGESAGRSKYNEMEIHRTNAEAKAHRIVHQWRCCIDYSEKDVWELLKRHHINPHPCYRIGWNRCSCMMCIFSTPRLFAGVKELFPDDYAALRRDEEVLGFTLDNKKNLDEFIGDTKSCVCWDDRKAIHSILTGEFTTDDIYINDWKYPVGAFHGADGGSC